MTRFATSKSEPHANPGPPSAVACCLALASLFAACGSESLATSEGDGLFDDTSADASSDTTADTVDASADTTLSDTATDDSATLDTESDVAPDSGAEDTGLEDADGSGDADVETDSTADGSGDDASDTGADATDDTTADTGSGCAFDMACDAPYACIADVCRLPLGGTTWAEDTFRLEEPEELTRVFALLKSFAPGVAFFVISVEDLPGSVTRGSYGTANVISDDVTPIDVAWQRPDMLERVTLRPHVPDAAPLDGETWTTDPFTYNLNASVNVTLPGRPATTYSIGFSAVNVTLNLSPQPVGPAPATITGMMTRTEAESRQLGTDADMAALRALFCTDTTWESPGATWALADLLDCNGAVIDSDSDGDGTLDAYRLVVNADMQPARVVLP